MKSIKELEAEEIEKPISNWSSAVRSGKIEALKDVLKLIDEIKEKYHDELVLINFIKKLKSKIQGK